MIIARDVKSGAFKGHVYRLGENDGVVRWVANPRLAPEILPATVARLDSARKLIDAKTLKVPE